MKCRVCGASLHLICNFRNDYIRRFLRHSRYPESITDNNERLEHLDTLSSSRLSVLRRIAEVDCYYDYGMSFERSASDMLKAHKKLTAEGKIPKR